MLSSTKSERMHSKSSMKPAPGSAYNLNEAFTFSIHDSICYCKISPPNNMSSSDAADHGEPGEPDAGF